MTKPLPCGLILLAAGGSQRMGRPKQLLPIGGRPLIRHMAELVLQAAVSPVVVVLGAEARQVEPALAGLRVRVALNPRWSEGQGTSLRVGVDTALLENPQLDAVIVVPADQPSLPSGHLDLLIATFRQGGCTLVASQTGTERVAPVLFGAVHFPRLVRFEGDTGARVLLQEFAAETATVPLPSNADLDTPEDYARYTQGSK